MEIENTPKLKPKVMIACNTLTSIQGESYMHHVRLFYQLGRMHPEYDFMNFFAQRMSIDRFRNMAAAISIKQNCRYLMFIDDDMVLPKESFSKLLEGCENNGYHILAALNYIRGYPFKIMSFKFDLQSARKRVVNLTQKDLEDCPVGSIIPCEAIGTAVCLIDVEYLKRTPTPHFLTGPHGTEDIYMCFKVKDYNPEVKIGTHTGVQTGHLLEPEFISHETRGPLKAYYEAYMTEEQKYEAQKDNPALAFIPNVGNRELHYEDIMSCEFEPVIQQ